MAVAIPYILVAATVASTAYSVYSSETAGRKEEKAQDRAAEQAMRSAELEAYTKGKEHRRILATQRAKYGGAGMEFEGTPLVVQFESIKESEEELRRILESGGIAAEAYRTRGDVARQAGYGRAAGYGMSGLESTFKLGRTYNWW